MFERIREFFRKFFNKEQIKLIEAPKNEDIGKKDISNFKEEIKLENNEEYRISDLQKKFKSGEIKVEQKKEEDKDALILLYIQNIKEQLKRLNA